MKKVSLFMFRVKLFFLNKFLGVLFIVCFLFVCSEANVVEVSRGTSFLVFRTSSLKRKAQSPSETENSAPSICSQKRILKKYSTKKQKEKMKHQIKVQRNENFLTSKNVCLFRFFAEVIASAQMSLTHYFSL
eukprot:GILJ01015858.1.p1 GENE.GILJ01015858.1~~GILJ01015858.1.p1  ORF type:complete len:132 (+),score=4.86 GILJ01015858.1:72-467(+)